jgi:serine/threonine-protein kinase
VFGNRYRIVERIGIGGMAEVYRATDEVLSRTVAVKVMLPQYAADPTFAARFKQEAQAAASLQSPYIVSIYDWGRDEADETYYIVMELVRGTDLKSAINQRGAISQRKVAEIGSQVCSALSVAHSYDIIHRDIKPHNIMIQPDGNAKVMDFGIARANGSAMTQTGSVLGTAYYVSPEQAQGKELAATSDLYSLGIVLYEAVTGRLPFEGSDAVTVALKQVNQQPKPPSEIIPGIDNDLEMIILKAMAKKPEDRYQNAEAMRMALNNYLTGQPIDSGIVDSQAVTTVMGAAGQRRLSDASANQSPESAANETRSVRQAQAARQIAQTSVMPVSTVSNASNHTLSATLEENRSRNRRKTVIVGVLAAAVILLLAGFFINLILRGNSPDMVRVPNVLGRSQAQAEQLIRENSLRVGQTRQEASNTIEKGLVISSNPVARTLVDRDSEIDLVISSGRAEPERKQVPVVTNHKAEDAQQEIEAAGFVYSLEGEEFHSTIEAGWVCRQSPEGNNMADAGSTVKCWISKGPEPRRVPSVFRLPFEDAEKILSDAGFKVELAGREFDNSVPKDQVIRQSPNAETIQLPGTVISLTISDGPEPPPTIPDVSVPDLEGKTIAEAISLLSGVGLSVESIDYADTTDPAEIGRVLYSDPAAGIGVPPGSKVKLVVGQSSPEP